MANTDLRSCQYAAITMNKSPLCTNWLSGDRQLGPSETRIEPSTAVKAPMRNLECVVPGGGGADRTPPMEETLRYIFSVIDLERRTVCPARRLSVPACLPHPPPSAANSPPHRRRRCRKRDECAEFAADPLLEGGGFEPSVPRRGTRLF